MTQKTNEVIVRKTILCCRPVHKEMKSGFKELLSFLLSVTTREGLLLRNEYVSKSEVITTLIIIDINKAYHMTKTEFKSLSTSLKGNTQEVQHIVICSPTHNLTTVKAHYGRYLFTIAIILKDMCDEMKHSKLNVKGIKILNPNLSQ